MRQENLKEHLPFFRQVMLFKDLPDTQISELMKLMSRMEVKVGEFITREGEKGDSLFILLEGNVEISKSLVMPLVSENEGKQEKSLIRLSGKDYAFFGEMSLFEDNPERSASIRALEPCQLIMIKKDELLKWLNTNPETGAIIFRNIATVLTRRLVKANKDILKLTTAFSLALEGE
jgi:CRP/FNR family cyclic AMP-dependent transcriptional regulator